jgi:hypothetical protein
VGIRETLNENRSITVGAMIGIIVLAIIWILWYSMGSSTPGGGSASAFKAYYTDDDGKTWFADDTNKTPPFDHNGKKAVFCYVYKCGENGKPFAAYLERYTEAGKKIREDMIRNKNTDPVAMEEGAPKEVKAPGTGDAGWMKQTDPRVNALRVPKCPDGQPALRVDPNM